MQTVADPKLTHYTYRVTWSAQDNEFVATCAEFPSLSWLASFQIEALQGLQDLLHEVIADMEQQGEEVPEPFAERSYSGNFNVRVGEILHPKPATRAAEDGLSLNG
ncbi:Predicted nuclease of the RNAse H fold, HicB family [Micromonospora pattaloongensis]|uniref:Predicted nuclease of the RNAse H fold, HicB family n=1 Tax=Micromonospora pattaloongensis TaxID=405436 RepID=A0A1H3GMM6_9ACTN|nr:toxin-antitoxin system HicB family antitoxin [Micromonospora pattaloongensis]SDY03888.1 Predicted nuclease of the RNAse H fold, HicB family [Micromonospora pattaloongensis]